MKKAPRQKESLEADKMASALVLGMIGMVVLGFGYIFIDWFIFKKHKAIVMYPNGKVRGVSAKRHKSQSAYSFLGFKNLSTEYIYGMGNKDVTFWYLEKNIPVPMEIDKKTKNFIFPNIMAQEYMVTVRKNQQDKTKTNFLERHFESITGLVMVSLCFVIYMYTINQAGNIDLSGVQPLVEMFVQQQNATASDLDRIANYVVNRGVPN